jgi:hypothetical protein
VIVYVPQVEVESYAQKIRDYPLEYFYRRLLFLKAEQVLADATCADELMARTPDYEKLVNQFILDYEEYRANQPLALWHEKDKTDFKAAKPRFGDLCQVLAVGEKRAYERRAAVLKGLHPLAMQVDMQTGVAVGVLVVRSARECAQVLKRLLLNELDFQLDEVGGRDEVDRGFTILKEGATDSQFRVVTHDEKVTNSFWNLFDGPGPIVEEWLP